MALVALVAGCAKDITVSNAFSVELTVPISSETKTTLGNKTGNTYPVYWSSSDVITLNGTPASSFVPGSGNTSASASFEPAVLINSPARHSSAPYSELRLLCSKSPLFMEGHTLLFIILRPRGQGDPPVPGRALQRLFRDIRRINTLSDFCIENCINTVLASK